MTFLTGLLIGGIIGFALASIVIWLGTRKITPKHEHSWELISFEVGKGHRITPITGLVHNTAAFGDGMHPYSVITTHYQVFKNSDKGYSFTRIYGKKCRSCGKVQAINALEFSLLEKEKEEVDKLLKEINS